MPISKPYYSEFKTILRKKLEEISQKVEPEEAGQLFENISPEATFLKDLTEGVTSFPFRYYQKEAIYSLHSILSQALDVCRTPNAIRKVLLKQAAYRHIKPLLEKVDKEGGKLAPFLGFEMATGSGKTMLMGASVYYLNKYHGIKNFLIVTPASTDIYNKTIRNFTKGSYETVWNDNVPFKFNLITGDNYKDAKDLFSNDAEANIFIFNISKFGTNATNTKKEWEGSEWKDKNGNTVSLLDYLAENDLAIITDEAHHAQSRKSKSIINAFKPTLVLEFTATAIEEEKSGAKKNQTIIYKYDIKSFLEDKYGKKVRVLALPGELKDKKRKEKATELSDLEKYKLITFFLVHLVKKKALASDIKCRNLKALGFVKVKNEISFSEKVEHYIKNEMVNDLDLLSVILEKAELEDTETTNLVLEMYKQDFLQDSTMLLEAIDKAAKTSILYHSKSDKLVKKQFEDIRKNKVEIVIFIDKLNEGIDMPNIYTMVVINDNVTDFKTSIKQIVGRGVRLNKLQREYDDVNDNDLLTHCEKLHVICDKGAAFEEVILQIQKEFGLNDKTFAIERGKVETVYNKVDIDKLKGIQLPKITIDFKRKKDIKIQDVITNYNKIVEDYFLHNSFDRDVDSRKSYFLKYTPETFFTEIDLFADKAAFHKMGEEQDWNYSKFELSPKDMKDVYGRVIQKLKPIPDIPSTFKTFQEYGNLLNVIGLYFYNIDEADKKLALNRFKDSFTYFYIHYVENEYFELDLKTLDSESQTWLLQNQFKDTKIKLRKNDIGNRYTRTLEETETKELIKNGYYFYGYDSSVYDYDKFDSYPEKVLADYADNLITKEPDTTLPFWVRNERNIHFNYGTHKYYPDFLMFYRDTMHVIEVKGEVFSNKKKNILLNELNKIDGLGKVKDYEGFVAFEVPIKKMKDFDMPFSEFKDKARQYYKQVESKSQVFPDNEVPTEERFKTYLPAYEVKQAYNKFTLGKAPKSLKWLQVRKAEYDNTVFATLIKNIQFGAEYKGKWLLFDAKENSVERLENKVVLCYHKSIAEDDYPKFLTIGKFNLVEERIKVGMFDETVRTIIITPRNSEAVKIQDKLDEFKVIGIPYVEK